VICGLWNCAISSDLEWPSRSYTYHKPFKVWFFVELCSDWQYFDWHNASHRLSATTAELLFFLQVKHVFTVITLWFIADGLAVYISFLLTFFMCCDGFQHYGRPERPKTRQRTENYRWKSHFVNCLFILFFLLTSAYVSYVTSFLHAVHLLTVFAYLCLRQFDQKLVKPGEVGNGV